MAHLNGNDLWTDHYSADDEFGDALALEKITLKSGDWEKEPSLEELEANPYLAEAQEALSRLYQKGAVKGKHRSVIDSSEWY